MKRKLSKFMAFCLVLCMAVPMLAGLADCLSAKAASASLSETKITVYLGTTFQLSVKNVDESTVKSKTWKANRTSIAKVDKNGLVTPVKAGTTTVKCTVAYKDGTSDVLACTVTVRTRVEATGVKLTNVTPDDGNAKLIYVGTTLSLKKSVTPSNTTDTVFYSSDDESVATISTSGVITAKKVGVTLIEVRYGMNKTDAARADNKAVAKFYLHVVEKPAPTPTPTATPTPSPTPTPTPVLPRVDSVKMVGSKEMQISFNQPVRKSSVLSGSKLLNGVVVLGKEENASDFGVLTATLSSDERTLTVRGDGTFNGTYSVVVSDKVISQSGMPFEQYAQIMSWKDTRGPLYTGTTVGYTGWLCQINFDEAIDISGMTIENVSATTDAVLSSYLKEIANYSLSEDGKSLLIDLSSCTSEKSLRVSISLRGLRDIAGNATANQLQTVIVQTDATTKPIARIVNVERISKGEIEATFSAEISVAGMAQFGSNVVYGIPSPDDLKKVRYEIPANYQSATGTQQVTFQGWYNFNAATSTGIPQQVCLVNFTLDTTPPQIINSDMVNALVDGRMVCELVLTYNKEILFASTAQPMTVRIRSTNGDISTSMPQSTTALVEGAVVTYIFDDPVMFGSGQFTITLPENMVADRLENYSKAATVLVNKNGTSSSSPSSSVLPMPLSAVQSSDDLNTVYLNFDSKIDPDTAEQVQNYYIINGSVRSIPIGASVSQNSASGAVVELTFNTGTFTVGYSSYELVVNGVRGYNSGSSAITNKSVVFSAIENNPPSYTSSTISFNTITITMSEEVTGMIRIMATDSKGVTYTGFGNASGRQIFITLDGIPSSGMVRYTIIDNDIRDYSGNRANFNAGQYLVNASSN